MSVVSEDGNMPQIAGSDSFWEIGQFKRSVKRIDDGLHLCHDLVSMIKERGEIEAGHAKHLNQWSKKWADIIAKGPEYGTLQAAWLSVLSESEKVADVHSRMRDRLEEEVQKTIKLWSKDQYHKSTFGGLKETKEADESFKKAQKPWAKLYVKVDKGKKDYHAACRSERTAVNQEKNAQGDTSLSADQTRKMTEKVEKCAEEVQKTKEVFQKSLEEINAYNSKYMEDMCQVFERCQEMERKRLKFFKDMLLNVHKCLDLSSEPRLKSIYEEFYRTVQLADDNQDLKWWEQNHGTGMAMNWPAFEQYSPELRRICKEPKNKEGVTLVATKPVSPTTGVYLRKQQPPDAKPGQDNNIVKNKSNGMKAAADTANGGCVKENGGGGGELDAAVAATSRPISTVAGGDANPFEDDWDTTPPSDSSAAAGRPKRQSVTEASAVPVKALYDYVGQEDDELSFQKGDVFDKLEDEDDQGWCKGRKDGKIGLYPANYVEAVKT